LGKESVKILINLMGKVVNSALLKKGYYFKSIGEIHTKKALKNSELTSVYLFVRFAFLTQNLTKVTPKN